MELEPGKVVEGKITKLLPYGAIVEMPEGVTGLIHISEIAHEFVRDVAQHLKVGDLVKAKVVGVKDQGKYRLSIKALSAAPASSSRPSPTSLEEKLSRFMRDSQETQSDLNRARQRHRGGGGARRR